MWIKISEMSLGKFNRVENSEPFLASGKIFLIQGSWNMEFIDQCASFPNGLHDDQVDASSGAFMQLARSFWMMIDDD